jgi:Tol biopolymer transport system component
MKKAFLLISLVAMPILCLPGSAFASVYIKYYNKDSQKYVFKVQMDGSTKEVTFNGSTTSASTIQGSGKKAVIETSCGNVEIKDDSKIEIVKGCIKVL